MFNITKLRIRGRLIAGFGATCAFLVLAVASTDIPQVECPFLHVVDVLCPEQAACTTFAVVWAPDPGTERDFWSRQLG